MDIHEAEAWLDGLINREKQPRVSYARFGLDTPRLYRTSTLYKTTSRKDLSKMRMARIAPIAAGALAPTMNGCGQSIV